MKRILFVVITVLLSCGMTFSQTTVTYERSSSIVNIDGSSYYVHTVKQGETLFSLARLYSVSEADIAVSNPHTVDGLQVGHVLKIPLIKDKDEKMSGRKFSKTFDVHTVNQGETLYSISRRYEIPVNVLLEDNPGLDPARLSIGQKLNIRKKSKGEASPEQIAEQIDEYKDAINSVSKGVRYHVVEKGETIYGLSKLYDVTEDDIIKSNNISGGLRTGDIIKIPYSGEDILAGGGHGDAGVPVMPPKDRPVYDDIKVKDFYNIYAPNVALLLPLKGDNGSSGRNFLDFYYGALLALEDLKAEGVSANIELYNTPRSEADVYRIVESPSFDKTDIIIGPVYQECLVPVIEFAEIKGVPVVSPLATFVNEDSPLIYQMAPAVSEKYNKLKELMTPDKNIVYITTSHRDDEMDKEIMPLLPPGHKVVNYGGNVKTTSISDVINKSADNLIFVSCTNELALDQILATISSAQNNLVARSISNAGITVVGTSRWNRFGRTKTLDRSLFFKLNVCFVSTYHADRNNELVRNFDIRYISAFEGIPSQYSYRGYDAVKLAVGAAKRTGRSYSENINSITTPLLQTKYNFKAMAPGTSFVNTEWCLVCYKDDFTIEVR